MKVKCLKCNTILESVHRHDFQMCDCENQTFVDGGNSYFRSGGMNFNFIEVYDEEKNKFISINEIFKPE